MTAGSKQQSRLEYEIRINRAMDFIREHLDQPLTLDAIAQAARFSSYHFHRIFYSFVNETVSDFVWRLRLEKAASMIKVRALPITEIALGCGFSSASNFAKAFKKRFGVSATQLRQTPGVESNPGKQISKPGALNRKLGKAMENPLCYSLHQRRVSKPGLQMEIKSFPGARVAYFRIMHGYQVPEIIQAWRRLMRWAGAQGLLTGKNLLIGIGHDNPFVTAQEKCRYDAAISLPDDFPEKPGINTLVLPRGQCAVYGYSGPVSQLERTYHEIYFSWLPESGLQPGNSPQFQIYTQGLNREPEKRYVSDLYVPVKPL